MMKQLRSVKELLKLEPINKNCLAYLLMKHFGRFIIGKESVFEPGMFKIVVGDPDAYMLIYAGITEDKKHLVIAEGDCTIIDIKRKKAYMISNISTSRITLKSALETLFEAFEERNINFVRFLIDWYEGDKKKYEEVLRDVAKRLIFWEEQNDLLWFLERIEMCIDEYNPKVIKLSELVSSEILEDGRIIAVKGEEEEVRRFFSRTFLELL